jgi:cytochrome c oxidase cbb3-type subunit 3
MASAATVVLPTESVVLISTNCRKMSWERARVASSSCAPAAIDTKQHQPKDHIDSHLPMFAEQPRLWQHKGDSMIRFIVYLCAALSIGALAAQPRGQKEFAQSCGFCHGDDATGSRGPDLVRSPLVNKDSGGDLIAPVIRNGRPDQGMPALPLPDNTIQDIVAFLHCAYSRPPRVPTSAAIIRGAPAHGKCGRRPRLFQWRRQVRVLPLTHRRSGRASRRDTRRFFWRSASSLRARAGVLPVTVTTPSGEQMSGKLEHLDEFSVSLRDAGGWYHSWPRDKVKVSVQRSAAGPPRHADEVHGRRHP